MGAVAWVSFGVFRQSLRDEVTENLSQIAKDKATHISNWIAERQSDAEVVSGSPMVMKRVETLTSPRTTARQRTEAKNDLETYLTLMKDTYGSYEELFILNPLGECLVSTGLARDNTADRSYFKRAIRGETAVTDIHISPSLNRPTMLISTPIRSTRGKVIGVFEERINLHTINEIMGDIKLGRTGESYLVNSEGYFITESQFEPGHTLKKKLSTQGVKDCLRGNTGVGEYTDYRGRMVLGAYYWLPERQWALIAEQDRKEAFDRVYRLRKRIVAIGGMASIVVFVISLMISRGIVQKLTTTNRELARKRQEQVISSGKLAAIGEMAAEMMHEINNPLTTIKSLVYYLHHDFDRGDPRRKDTAIVMGEIDKINTLTLRFLQFARPREPEFGPININRILDKVVRLFEHQIASQQIKVTKNLQPDISLVKVDGQQMGQVFVNLIMNALQAMPEGGELDIFTEAGDLDGAPAVRIGIRDTGGGISDDIEGRIFDPFFTTKTSGTGLGLSITRRIIERNKGEIEFKSEQGEGSTFLIHLPTEKEGRVEEGPSCR